MHNTIKAKSLIIEVAAKLVKIGPSPFREDYPKSVPNYIIIEMSKHSEELKTLSFKLATALELLRNKNV